MNIDSLVSVRLVDRGTRQVEVLGAAPAGARRTSDRTLFFYQPQASPAELQRGPQSVGLCIRGDDRRSRFYINEGSRGDRFLDALASRSRPVALAKPYSSKGWLVDGLYTRSARTATGSGQTYQGEIFQSAGAGRVLRVT